MLKCTSSFALTPCPNTFFMSPSLWTSLRGLGPSSSLQTSPLWRKTTMYFSSTSGIRKPAEALYLLGIEMNCYFLWNLCVHEKGSRHKPKRVSYGQADHKKSKMEKWRSEKMGLTTKLWFSKTVIQLCNVSVISVIIESWINSEFVLLWDVQKMGQQTSNSRIQQIAKSTIFFNNKKDVICKRVRKW